MILMENLFSKVNPPKSEKIPHPHSALMVISTKKQNDALTILQNNKLQLPRVYFSFHNAKSFESMNRGLRGWFWQLVTYMQIICHPILALEIKISIYANSKSQYFQGQLPLSKMAVGKQVAEYLKEGSFPSFTVFLGNAGKDTQRSAVLLKISYPTKLLMT